MNLNRAELHSSLVDPLLHSMNFLNEVMERYPDAISFAPGAPYRGFLKDLDIAACIDRYVQHLCDSSDITRDVAWDRLFRYGPSRGIINDLIAQYLLNDDNIMVSPEAIVVTVGCQEALVVVLRALFRSSSDKLVLFDPSYIGAQGAARLLDISVQTIEEDDWGRTLDLLDIACQEAHIDGEKVRAVYLSPDFANPSGHLLSLERRHAAICLARKHNFILLEDTAYRFTADPDAKLPSLMELDDSGHVILLGTFAKTCLPGARVGFIVAPQSTTDAFGDHPLADDLATIKSMITNNTSPICQAIIGGILLESDCSLQAACDERGAFYRSNLETLIQSLEEYVPSHVKENVTWNSPAGGFFVRLNLRKVVSEALLDLSASRYGVVWTPLGHFRLDGMSTELRLSCSYLTKPEIREGVRRLARFLEDPVLATEALNG